MILVIDNYDSFVHNLARYVRELGGDAVVRRNDEVTLTAIEALAPRHITLSPAPPRSRPQRPRPATPAGASSWGCHRRSGLHATTRSSSPAHRCRPRCAR